MEDSMAFIHTPGKRRSNRALTNFAIRAVTDYLSGGQSIEWTQDNTAVYLDSSNSIVVELFDRPILELKRTGDKVSTVYVCSGDYYDNYEKSYGSNSRKAERAA